MPSSSRDFLRAADQRLATSEFLLENGYTLDAMYLAGYSIECALKALILAWSAKADRGEILKEISSGKKSHDPEVLNEFLKEIGHAIPLRLVKKYRRSGWSTNLRYETGRRDTGETRAFLKVAKETYVWVGEELP